MKKSLSNYTRMLAVVREKELKMSKSNNVTTVIMDYVVIFKCNCEL